jgi:phosphopentomutase
MARRAAVIVLDGVGIGAADDAATYGDAGSNTLGNLAEAVGGLSLPALDELGLGSIASVRGLRTSGAGKAARCSLHPRSAGKDSITGHWELCGVILDRPFPTYPAGFPDELLREFARLTGRSVIGNVVGSGTTTIDQFADAHVATGGWIVYTSADSVFQVAAHESVIPLDELYEGCTVARRLCTGQHSVARVIARPFTGEPGAWRRTTNRRDFSLEPVGPTLLDALAEAGTDRAGVGKVDDLFAGRSISSHHTRDNSEGISRIEAWMSGRGSGFLLANLVDFDQLYGHRNDVEGFYEALRAFDRALPRLLSLLTEDDLLVITADHGNDPTTTSTDHSRERVPMVMTGGRVRAGTLAERPTFADLGATLGEWFGLEFRGRGTSFLREVLV